MLKLVLGIISIIIIIIIIQNIYIGRCIGMGNMGPYGSGSNDKVVLTEADQVSV